MKALVRASLFAILLAFAAQASKAQKVEKVDFTKCFEVSSKKWGTHCGEPKSFEVRWKNVCKEKMDIKYAIRKEDGTWEIGIDFNVDPGQETVNSAWVCQGTGLYLWWARPSEQWLQIKFPSDAEISKLK